MVEGFRGSRFRFKAYPAPPNYPLSYPKYPLLRAIKALLKGTWGVLDGLGF